MAAGLPSNLNIDDIKQRTRISDAQLDRRIEGDNLWELAGLLGSYELYVGRPGFGLNEGDIADLRDCAKDNGHQYTMKKAFLKWFNVTRSDMISYRSLVNILIELRKKTVAEDVCRTGELFRASYTQCALSLFIASGWDTTQ